MQGNDMQVISEAIKEPNNDRNIRKMFRRYDKGNRGYLKSSEFRRFAIDFVKVLGKAHVAINTPESTWKFPEELFKMADTDGNGQVSFEELVQILQIRDFWELAEKLHEFNPERY